MRQCCKQSIFLSATLLLSAMPTGALAQLQAQAVAEGVTLLRGAFTAGSQPDGNSVLFETTAGMVVVDTGRHASHTQAIIERAHSRRTPIIAAFNTHWHLDHVGGNPLLRAAFPGVRVYASTAIEQAMHGFLARYREQLQGALAQSPDAAASQGWRDELALIDAGAALYPDVAITHDMRLRLGGRDFDVHLTRHAATAGDVWLFEPRSRTLVAGDLVTLPVPFLDTACAQGWRMALDRLARVPFRVLLPGHGAPMTRAQFDAWHGAYARLIACARGPRPSDSCSDGWMRDARVLLAGTDVPQARRMLGYYMDHVLRDPAGGGERHCED